MKKKKILTTGIIVVASLTMIAGGLILDNFKDNQSNVETEIINNGIKLYLLSESENLEGETIKTFSYTITPEDATNQDIKIAVQYKGGGNCEDKVTATIDIEKKLVTVTCLEAFDKEIEIILTSLDNPAISGKVLVNYLKKINDVALELEIWDEDNNLLITPEYSIFSKDQEYTFSIAIESIYCNDYNFSYSFPEQTEAMMEIFKSHIENDLGLPTEEDFISVANGNNKYINALIENNHWSYYNLDVDYSITVMPGGKVFEKSDILCPYVTNDEMYDFSPYKIAVTSINPDLGNIDF